MAKKEVKSTHFVRTIVIIAIIILIAAYAYTIPTSFRLLTEAGFSIAVTIPLCLLVSTITIILTTLAVGLAVSVGCIAGGALICLFEYFSARHNFRQKKG